jgi:hypothetical protein
MSELSKFKAIVAANQGMNPFTPRSKNGPEYKIRERFIALLRSRGWYVKIQHGNAYTSGLPDLIATHKEYGLRFPECKNPESYEFTNAQIHTFPELDANGFPIHVITGADEENYQRLFKAPNWRDYWKSKYDKILHEYKHVMDIANEK